MGKGLNIKPTGTHIAFTAGTGCLVFLDLVGFILRSVLNLNNAVNKVDYSNMRFIFFVSFPNQKESIGLDFCNGV